MINRKANTAKNPTLDALGDQIISNEVAIISLLQVLTAQPAIRIALVHAMRENNSRVPSGFHGVRERIDQYVELLEKRLPTQAPQQPREGRRPRRRADKAEVLHHSID